MRFRGKILRDGQIVLDPATGDLQESETAGGIKRWGGQVALPTGKVLPVGDSYQLVLDDGRKGDILVARGSYGSHQASVVTFAGSGPLQ